MARVEKDEGTVVKCEADVGRSVRQRLPSRRSAGILFAAKCELCLFQRFEVDFPDVHGVGAFRFKDDPFVVARKPGVAVEAFGIGDVARF